MIPNCISWKYQRMDITNPHQHGIANSVECALNDIPLVSLLPSDKKDFTMFLCTILNQNNRNLVLTALKTPENISEDEWISKGSFYTYYIIPSNVEISSSNLSIHDMFHPELYIEINIDNIFNKNKINIITFPENTFLFK